MRSPMPSNTTSDTASSAASLEKVDPYLPMTPALLFRSGLRIVSQKAPRSAVCTYRHGLDRVLKPLQLSPEDLGLWKLVLLFDGLIKALISTPGTLQQAIKRRVDLFLSGD